MQQRWSELRAYQKYQSPWIFNKSGGVLEADFRLQWTQKQTEDEGEIRSYQLHTCKMKASPKNEE